MNTSPLLLRPEACANALGVGRSMVYELLAAGAIESIKIGRRRLIPASALDAFIQKQRELQAERA